mgnify:FL=1
MATKQNGVLGSFTPTVTPYTNDTRAANSLTVAPQEFPFYTCPGATMVSAKLLISNNTGGAATVDVGITEQTDVIQLDAAASQPGAPTNYLGFSFPNGQFTTSIYVDVGGVTGTFTAGEPLTWTNPAMTPTSQTATVQYWDASNNRLWVRGLANANALYPATGDIQYTGTNSGATASSGASFAGTGTTRGNSGKIKFWDNLRGIIYFDNHEFRNNLDYRLGYFGDLNQEVRELNNNNLQRSHTNRHRPVGTTVDRIAAVNTTPATEFIDANGVELLVSGVSMIKEHQYLVKQKSINDASIFELGGIVLGAYQSIYVKSTAAVTATLLGFEETAEIAS